MNNSSDNNGKNFTDKTDGDLLDNNDEFVCDPVIKDNVINMEYVSKPFILKKHTDASILPQVNFSSFVSRFINCIFKDMRDDDIIVGPTEDFGLTYLDLKKYVSMMADDHMTRYLQLYYSEYGSQPIASYNKNKLRMDILNIAARYINNSQIMMYGAPQLVLPKFEPIALTKSITSDPNLREFVDIIYNNSKKDGQTHFVHHSISYTVVVHKSIENENDFPVFVRSNGDLDIIQPIVDTTVSEGIHIFQHSHRADGISGNRVKLPEGRNVVSSDVLSGVFFSSYETFREIYKEKYDEEFNKKGSYDKLFNISKMTGKYLFDYTGNGSHGLTSSIVGYSLKRKKFYTCSPDSGVTEIINVTPNDTIDGSIDQDFTKVIYEAGLTERLLMDNDYIIRTTIVRPGCSGVKYKTTYVEKIALSLRCGLNDLRNSISDNDLAVFNETGLAIFSTKEAAERCMIHSKGDIHKYIHYIYNKISSKGEKNAFVESLKNALLVGAGAVIPKVVESIVGKPKKETKEKNMSIMKSMLPPIAAGIGKIFSINSDGKIFESILKITNTILKGYATMNIVKNIFSGIKFLGANAGKIAGKVKSILQMILNLIVNFGKKGWDIIKSIFGSVVNGVKILFDFNIPIMDKFKLLFNSILGAGKFIVNGGVNIVKSAFSTVKKGVSIVVNFVANTANKVYTWFTGLFKKTEPMSTNHSAEGASAAAA